ncbi:unnamed protein product [Prorocentrum cordatum]|uniref:Uncharacterized protein n=1 Tax=Prorocentrum cordatum TaxID=2364126 RepID=A0ABN9SEI3_9DINO|nr:unnamed protein product [Polarella glacialis]
MVYSQGWTQDVSGGALRCDVLLIEHIPTVRRRAPKTFRTPNNTKFTEPSTSSEVRGGPPHDLRLLAVRTPPVDDQPVARGVLPHVERVTLLMGRHRALGEPKEPHLVQLLGEGQLLGPGELAGAPPLVRRRANPASTQDPRLVEGQGQRRLQEIPDGPVSERTLKDQTFRTKRGVGSWDRVNSSGALKTVGINSSEMI